MGGGSLVKKGKTFSLRIRKKETLLESAVEQRKQKCYSVLRPRLLELEVGKIDWFQNQVCLQGCRKSIEW